MRVRGEFTLSSERADVDVDVVHRYLTASYWAEGIPRETVVRSIEGSIPFSVFHEGKQVAFARVISDGATFAYLSDVFVLPPWRGRGLSAWMMEAIMAHPGLQGLRRWMLTTRDAHGLYRKFGFADVGTPGAVLEINRRGMYLEE